MAYAAARLAAEGYPRASTLPAERGDDLAFREGAAVPLEGAANPSYSHGEPWTDDGDGIREPNEQPGADLDGDGRFSAWTGRLRGAKGPSAGRFSLKVEIESAKLPVNAGYLDLQDRNGNWVPDCRDHDVHPYHVGVATAIDNLAVILDVQTRRTLPPGGTSPLIEDWIRPAWLGQDLLASRPPGGYRGLAEVDAVLVAHGYTASERGAVLPHLTVESPLDLGEGGRALVTDGADHPRHVPVNLAAASREVLAAHWLYLSTRGFYVSGQPGGFSGLPGWGAFSSRRGPPFGFLNPYLFSYPASMLVIHEDEARALADRVVQLRSAGPVSWEALHRDFSQNASTLFARDFADLLGGIEAQVWTQAKAELAFRAVSPDPHPFGRCEGSATWAGWGIDRFADDPLIPWTAGVQQYTFLPLDAIRRVAYPPPPAPDTAWDLANQPTEPFGIGGTLPILPSGFSLEPPGRYSVASLGAAGGASFRSSGDLAAAETLLFACQEDFENLAGGARLAPRGIQVLETADPDPAKRHDWRASDPLPDGTMPDYPNTRPRVQPHAITHPRWNRRSVASAAAGLGPDYQGCSRLYGAVTLAAREQGHRDSKVYWPFKEDFDGSLNNGGVPAVDAKGDFWSENGPGGPAAPILYPVFLYDGIYGTFAGGWPVEDPTIGTPTSPDTGNLAVMMPFTFPCPGTAPPHLAAFSVECWMGPESNWTLSGKDVSPPDQVRRFDIGVTLQRGQVGAPPATEFRVNAYSEDTITPMPPPFNLPTLPAPWRIEDGDNPEDRTAWHYHVVLSVESDGTATDVSLYVNGRDTDSGGAVMKHLSVPALLHGTFADETLVLHDCDEFRIYDWALTQADADRRWRNDRFVRYGRFVSPLYAFDAPVRLDKTQWTGLVPPAPSFAPHCLSVEVTGYADAAGAVPAGPPVPCPASGAVHPLAGLGPVRSFRYTVTFDCRTVPAVLDDTPVFESVWFTFRRKGRSPAWTRWD